MIQDDVKYLLPLQVNHCDGILVIGGIPEAQFKRIHELGIPMVAIDHYCDHIACDYINSANEYSMIKAVDFLTEHGHKKIGFINNETAPYNYSLMRRYQGYVRRMEQAGLTVDPIFVWPDSTYADNDYLRRQMDVLTAHGDRPTAWVCVNDLTAYNFCSVLMERGLRVPDDVSVIGNDNIQGAFHTRLTTLEVPKYTMGSSALRKLMNRIHHPDEPFESVQIFTRLLDRGSVKKI
jgi:DNA-binding LacI/PurR family transcriptional regulator